MKRIEEEYKEDLIKAQENHDKMIKLIKEKLYDKLQKQIKQLKEDKLLLNLVNANSWSSNIANDSSTAALNAVAANTLNLSDRRSLRKRELSSRLTAGEADDLSDGGVGSTTATGNVSTANGDISLSGKRRRHYATRYSFRMTKYHPESPAQLLATRTAMVTAIIPSTTMQWGVGMKAT